MRSFDVRKLTLWLILLLISMSFLFNGCAAPEKKLAQNELQKITKIKVARLKCPSLLKETTGAMVVGVTGVMFGAIGGGIGGAAYYKMMESAGKKVQQNFVLPDFSELLMDQFAKRAPQELSALPEMEVEHNPVTKDISNSSGYLLLIGVNMVKLKNGTGLITVSTAKLVDPKNKITWQKNYKYESKKFDRVCKLKELEADKGKLLHEEYHFAANKAITEFINDLKGSVSSNQN